MGKTLIIKGANFRANGVDIHVPFKVLTTADFTVSRGFFIGSDGIVTGNPQGQYSGSDTPISEYIGRRITVTAQLHSASWIGFTNKALANSVVGENIAVSTMTRLSEGNSVTLTIPSNAQYLYVIRYSQGIDVFPSEINIW